MGRGQRLWMGGRWGVGAVSAATSMGLQCECQRSAALLAPHTGAAAMLKQPAAAAHGGGATSPLSALSLSLLLPRPHRTPLLATPLSLFLPCPHRTPPLAAPPPRARPPRPACSRRTCRVAWRRHIADHHVVAQPPHLHGAHGLPPGPGPQARLGRARARTRRRRRPLARLAGRGSRARASRLVRGRGVQVQRRRGLCACVPGGGGCALTLRTPVHTAGCGVPHDSAQPGLGASLTKAGCGAPHDSAQPWLADQATPEAGYEPAARPGRPTLSHPHPSTGGRRARDLTMQH